MAYSALKTATSIRLLEVYNIRNNPSRVEVSLIDADLDSEPLIRYRALSYCWNIARKLSRRPSRGRSCTLLCNGCIIKIQENLYDALTSLSHQINDRPLWVDSICINQSDADERASQVKLMGRIYSSAEQVLVWLGKPNSLLNRSVDALLSLETRDYDEVSSTPKQLLSLDLRKYQEMRMDRSVRSKVRPGTRELRRVQRFFTNGWFHRVWVVQEAILAQEIVFYVGDGEIPTEAVYRGILFAFDSRLYEVVKKNQRMDLGAEPSQRLTHYHTTRMILELCLDKRRREDFSALDYLLITWSRDAGDIKDKVYGVLGLVRDNPSGRREALGRDRTADDPLSPDLPTPDYRKTIVDVFRECTVFLLGTPDGLAVLSLAGLSRPSLHYSSKILRSIEGRSLQQAQTSGLPSWVVDFNLLTQTVPLAFAFPHNFHAGGQVKSPVMVRDNGDLGLQASLWDRVSIVGEDSVCFQHPYYDLVGDFLNLASSIGDQYSPTGESTLLAMQQTFTASYLARQDLLRGWEQGFYDKSSAFDDFGGLGFLTWLVNTVEEAVKTQSQNSHMDKVAFAFTKRVRPGEMGEHDRHTHPKVHRERSSRRLESAWKQFLDRVDKEQHVRGTIKTNRHFEGHLDSNFSVVFGFIFKHRRIFLTERGFLGIGPSILRPGDRVALVSGACIPLILRGPLSQERWQLVGECYIHGAMMGEFLNEDDSEFRGVFLH